MIRDKIPELIMSKGEKIFYHIADKDEYWHKLKEKLFEETKEFNDSEDIEEIVDLMEVIDAIIEYKKFSIKEIEEIKNKKNYQKGKFKKRIILDES